MSDLISRKYVVSELLKEREHYPPMVAERYSFGVKLPHRFNQAMRGGIRKALRIAETAPAVEAEPVRRNNMPTVICPNNMCLYNDDFKGICTFDGCIHAEEECEAFKSYREESEYQEEFWMACEAHGKKYRTNHYGKRIEVKGLILYTEDRLPPQALWDDPRASVHCTEKETGFGLSLHNVFNPKAYERILEYIREQPNVMDLPEKMYAEVEG